MKTLAKFLAPLLAAVLGYSAAVVFQPVEKEPRVESVPKPAAEAADRKSVV